MVVDTTLYDRLNLPPTATSAEIIQAGRKLSGKWHPDKNAHQLDLANAKFKEIREAVEILSDEMKRKRYDQVGLKGANAPDANESGFPFPFGGHPFAGASPFASHPFGGQSAKQVPRVEVNVTLEQIACQETVTVRYSSLEKCESCEGRCTSREDIQSKTCGGCNGLGRRMDQVPIGPGMFQTVQRPCPACMGRGKQFEKKEDVCTGCDGQGKRDQVKSFAFQLYPRMTPTSTYIQNNVAVTIREAPHDAFTRDPRNPYTLHADMDLNLFEALFGFTKNLHLPDRRIVKVRWVGKTEYGQVRKVIGAGLDNQGDVLLQFRFSLPHVTSVEAVAEYLHHLTPPEPSDEQEKEEDDEECISMAMVDLEEEDEDDHSSSSSSASTGATAGGGPQECRMM